MSSIPPNQPYAQNPFGGQQQQRQQLPPNQQLQQYYQQKARTPSLPNTGGPSNYVDQGLSPGQFQTLPQDYGPGFSSPSPAQRTHRERKEAYLRQLESEITRLREAFSIVTKEKTSLTNENAELKKFLALHGLSWPPDPSIDPTSALAPAPIPPPPPVALGSMPGIPASLVGAQPLAQLVTAPSTGPSYLSPTGQYGQPTTSPNVSGAFDAIGIDFVLALERPCMEHIQKLVHDSLEDPNGTSISGHALMASCPPESHMLDNPDIDWGSRTYDLQPSELNMLLNLSPKLGVSGEVTPINAWAIIQSHPNFLQLTRHDFAAIKNELVPKVKCYGFGAVLEEYMVEDALDAVFAAKYALANQRVNNSHYSF
ncbi:hypothetical protein TWF569_011922 [Orbilia oligospora]|uniref:BZIP domain-containing protein n=1 Tax=Orbilia oligospora TaxID=2813651 RepID=A0A7C8JI97_ORBOL|nr:hypothetical protein TWF703_002919 [Orbilia oligospora]KAF3126912.1 hypothetical protein TWF569_011922 [Orbilia oligospora]